MLGWVQLVDDSYHGGGFHADGFEPLGPLPHPFGFYGISPTLDLLDPAPLPPERWDGHSSYLEGCFPEWTFATGYSADPYRP